MYSSAFTKRISYAANQRTDQDDQDAESIQTLERPLAYERFLEATSKCNFLIPSTDEEIRLATHPRGDPDLPFPSDEDSFVQVRRFLFNILTINDWGTSLLHPAVVRATVDAWIGTGRRFRQHYESCTLLAICPTGAIMGRDKLSSLIPIADGTRTLITSCIGHECELILANKRNSTATLVPTSKRKSVLSMTWPGGMLLEGFKRASMLSVEAQQLHRNRDAALSNLLGHEGSKRLSRLSTYSDQASRAPEPMAITAGTSCSYTSVPKEVVQRAEFPPVEPHEEDFEPPSSSVRRRFSESAPFTDLVSNVTSNTDTAQSRLFPSLIPRRRLQPCSPHDPSGESVLKSIRFEDTVENTLPTTNRELARAPRPLTVISCNGLEQSTPTPSRRARPTAFIREARNRLSLAKNVLLMGDPLQAADHAVSRPTDVRIVASATPMVTYTRFSDALEMQDVQDTATHRGSEVERGSQRAKGNPGTSRVDSALGLGDDCPHPISENILTSVHANTMSGPSDDEPGAHRPSGPDADTPGIRPGPMASEPKTNSPLALPPALPKRKSMIRKAFSIAFAKIRVRATQR
ncbi:hypothetical protein BDV95DRAFT_607203 [Massariosphaeria phaeospora]|uniref:Uncharacterized protein n=1 Tax=Massariosphaeria phaeospora TaxID=100035 RepID=A0A7C8M8N4_9PLEO|nr:hypothetical protein BDV95DRAFT_607203 [Massariosphaeria phaeospora]